MAVNSFDDILSNLVSDDADKEVLGNLANKYPDIKNGWLRQSDYSRKMDSLKETTKKVEEWEKWADDNWDFDAGTTKAEQTLKRELVTKGEDMTFDQVKDYTEKTLSERGIVTKTDFDSVLGTKSKEVSDGLQGTAAFNAILTEKAINHLYEFKEPFKVREFLGKLNELGSDNLDLAYDKYVAPERETRRQKDHEKEIEKIRAEERSKTEAEMNEKFIANRGLPVDQTEDGLGHLQSKMLRVNEPDAAEKATLGDGTIARIAAAQYRKDKLGA